jgi:hypothetical protein
MDLVTTAKPIMDITGANDFMMAEMLMDEDKDPYMVAEYAEEIFAYMRDLEVISTHLTSDRLS